MFAHVPSILLKNATITSRGSTTSSSDLRIDEGSISAMAVGGSLTPQADEEVVDLDGYLLLPTAVEPHAHLDKAFLAEHVENPTGDLLGAIEAMSNHRHLFDREDTIERAERAAQLMAANGYSAIRTHADTTTEQGLLSIEALTEVRRRMAEVIDIEIVALCGSPIVGPDGADQRALLKEALSSGADLVGGCPHLEDQGDLAAATEIYLEAATDHGVGVDLHTDETLDSDVLGLVDLAQQVLSGFEYRVTASHCVSLGMQSHRRQQEIAELVAEAAIGVVALPHTNLFLQGRGQYPMPRGLTAVAALQSAGVSVAAGADNLQDPFNPVGRGCPFETAGLMVIAAHLLPTDAWSSVSAAPRQVLGLPPGEIEVGAVSNMFAVRADSVREAIAFGPADRIVWRKGTRLQETQS